MALTDKLTAIGNAIRAKTGKTDLLTLTQMVAEIEGISGGGDIKEIDYAYNQQNDHVTAYLADTSEYTDDNYASVSVANNYKDTSQTTWERPNGTTITVSSAGTIQWLDEGAGSGFVGTVTAGSNNVYNLAPNHYYSFTVRNSSGQITDLGRIKASGQIRMIYAPSSLHNFRDIGGWSADGGTVRYGLIYRGAQLSYYSSGSDKVYPMIDSTGIKYLRDLGIRSEIDLRTDAQVTGITSSVLGDDVEYKHYAYSDASYINIASAIGPLKTQTKAVVKLIMENVAKGVPTYIHCQAGADRTGTFAFILEALLGVSGADCDRDYELTTFYYAGSYLRTRNSGASGGWIELRNYFDSLEGDTLQDKAVTWCKAMGIECDLVNRYRSAMIDGIPTLFDYTIDSDNSGDDDPDTPIEKVNLLPLAVDSDGSAYNGGVGFKEGYRLNSSGLERAQTNADCTGFIPMTSGQTLELSGVKLPANNNVPTNSGIWTMHFYDASFDRISYASYQPQDICSRVGTSNYTAVDNYIKTLTMTLDGMAYVRFSADDITSDTVVYVY